MAKVKLSSLLYVLLYQLLFSNLVQADPLQKNIELANNEEINFTVYGSNKRIRILWISSSYGFNPRHQQSAELLAQSGMEIWQTDLVENLFLPKGADSIRSVPGEMVAGIIEKLSGNGK